MVKELILDDDKVVLPGLGCFVAEIVPAYFSDKGYTINPPYRKLYFRARPDEGDTLIDFYARSNDVSYDVAERIIKDFVSELKASDIDFSPYEKKARAEVKYRPANERNRDFCAITDGLTEEQAIAEARRCLECGCHDYSECRLIREARKENIDPARLAGKKNVHESERKLVCIERNNGKCILCSLCVRTCTENAKKGLLGLVGRGFDTVIKPEWNRAEIIEGCRDCHLCVDVCPTGALKFIESK